MAESNRLCMRYILVTGSGGDVSKSSSEASNATNNK